MALGVDGGAIQRQKQEYRRNRLLANLECLLAHRTVDGGGIAPPRRIAAIEHKLRQEDTRYCRRDDQRQGQQPVVFHLTLSRRASASRNWRKVRRAYQMDAATSTARSSSVPA